MKRTLADELHSTLLERSLQAPGPDDTIAAVLARTGELSGLSELSGQSGQSDETAMRPARAAGPRLVPKLRRRPLYALVGLAAALAIGNGVVLLQSHQGGDQKSASTSAGAGAAVSGDGADRQGPVGGSVPAVPTPRAGSGAAGVPLPTSASGNAQDGQAATAVANCTAADLGGVEPAQFQARPGGATIKIVNHGSAECAIRGLAVLTPEIGGRPVSGSSTAYQVPAIPSVVVLGPGVSATALVTAADNGSGVGCRTSDHVRILLPNIAGSSLVPANLPTCDLEVGPFAP